MQKVFDIILVIAAEFGMMALIAGLASLFSGDYKARNKKNSNRPRTTYTSFRSNIPESKPITKIETSEKTTKNKHELDNVDIPCYNNSMYVKVFHLTSLSNLESIKRDGILSRSAVESGRSYTDIAETGALNNHRGLLIDGKPLDQYARCFFNPLPPMYYNRVNSGRDDLCIIELHIPVEKVTKIYSGRNCVFHNLKIDGTKYPRIYRESIAAHRSNIREIEAHNLDVIRWNPNKSALDNNRDETIAKRGAELLVYPKIPAKYIAKIYSKNHTPISNLERIRDLGHPQIIEERP